jgi:hypothetical protein
VGDKVSWAAVEIDELRAEVEELECSRDAAEESADNWYNKFEDIQHRMQGAVANERIKGEEMNLALRDKSMIYLSLINEYEELLDFYVARTGVKVMTDNLKRILNLKQRGGLIT